ncbi:MAG: ATP phosphoribosyltransferase regulatory subunit [Lachnospiraceae bacterium]|nr:ATP phosphoribosyltransferase regulatory subunit [Lachnospiraceae bacterium]
MKQFMIPTGMRDLIPSECALRKKLQKAIEDRLDRCGYQEVVTPTIEYYKTYETGFYNINEQDMYKFFDAQGRILMLRADMTIPIARLAATKFKDVNPPLRFRYCANVFKVHEDLSGKKNEISDCGVELIGVPQDSGDLEILMTALDALSVVKNHQWVLEIGNINFFREACRLFALSVEDSEELSDLIDRKSMTPLAEKLKELKLPDNARQFFLQLPWMSGDQQMLEDAKQYCFCEPLKEIIERMIVLAKDLQELGCERVQFDLGKTKNLNYYTGIVFEAYVEGVGKRVLSGGRYDTLLEKYGRNLPAVGFSIKLDAFAEIGEMIQPPKETVITYHPSRRIEAMKKAKELVETTKITLIADESANELTIKEG